MVSASHFELTPAGVEQLLHRFATFDGQGSEGITIGPNGETVIWRFNETDGSVPFATLMQGPDGAIYGTTYRGGTGTSGYGGTVFKLTM